MYQIIIQKVQVKHEKKSNYLTSNQLSWEKAKQLCALTAWWCGGKHSHPTARRFLVQISAGAFLYGVQKFSLSQYGFSLGTLLGTPLTCRANWLIDSLIDLRSECAWLFVSFVSVLALSWSGDVFWVYSAFHQMENELFQCKYVKHSEPWY